MFVWVYFGQRGVAPLLGDFNNLVCDIVSDLCMHWLTSLYFLFFFLFCVLRVRFVIVIIIIFRNVLHYSAASKCSTVMFVAFNTHYIILHNDKNNHAVILVCMEWQWNFVVYCTSSAMSSDWPASTGTSATKQTKLIPVVLHEHSDNQAGCILLPTTLLMYTDHADIINNKQLWTTADQKPVLDYPTS